MSGKDVTPRISEKESGLQPEDLEATSEYKKRQTRTSELEFLEALYSNGMRVYERVSALGKREGMQVKWGREGFSLNAVSNGTPTGVCWGYPSSAYN